MAEFSLGTQETAGKLWNGKLTTKEHREGPSQLVLKVGFLERGLGQGSQQNSGRERYSTGLQGPNSVLPMEMMLGGVVPGAITIYWLNLGFSSLLISSL